MSLETQPPAPRQPEMSARVDNLRREIQQLVGRGIESPRFELTRKCSLASGERKSQTDFAKTIQGMSNAYPSAERAYVVGADQKEKKFYPLENEREFDPANLRQILEKYLGPVPNFEAYTLETDDHIKFAAVVLAAEQAHPIVVRTSVQGSGGQAQLLQEGDIWIKKQTGLARASRDDIERMYETRIEGEAERRAQQRFADLRDGLEASFRLQTLPERRIPSEDLVFGPAAEYRAYIEQLLANRDVLRFHMVVTTLRDLLVERWHSVNAYVPEVTFEGSAKVADHFQNAFQPALRRLVYAGLLLIKQGLNVDRFERVADLLIEAFGVSGKLPAFPTLGAPAGQPTKGTVAVEVLLGARVLATYAMRMARYGYLPPLLKKYVAPVGSRAARKQEPFLFWPLRVNVPGNDRIAYTWQHTVQPHWLEFFGNEASFHYAASQLEFILDLNSYLATKNPAGKQWVSQYRPDTNFEYWEGSDLWRYPLDAVVPLAERMYETLALGPNYPFFFDFSVEHAVFQQAFSTSPQEVFEVYLFRLERWSAEAASGSGRFPQHEPDWGPVLGPRMRRNGG
jgi:hypothetical protein